MGVKDRGHLIFTIQGTDREPRTMLDRGKTTDVGVTQYLLSSRALRRMRRGQQGRQGLREGGKMKPVIGCVASYG